MKTKQPYTPGRLLSITLVLSFIGTTPSLGQLLPFIDDFNDGDATDGTPGTWLPGLASGGTRDASSGDFVVTHTSSMSTFAEELNGLRDVSIRTQLRFSQVSGNRDFASIWARSPLSGPSDPAAYVGGIGTDGVIFINYFVRSGENNVLDSANTSLDPVGGDVNLKFDVFGDQLSLTAWQEGDPMPSSPQLSATDTNLFQGGQVGFSLNPNSNGGNSSASLVFRYYEVVPEPTALVLVLSATFCLLRRRPRRGRCPVGAF